MIIVKTNYNGEFRRFTVDKHISYDYFVSLLQSMYVDQGELLLPPTTHSLKYFDEEGDFVGLMSTNDLSLAFETAFKLNPPLLRIVIEKKLNRPQIESNTPVPLVKIRGKDIYSLPPEQTKERYGPTKMPQLTDQTTLTTQSLETQYPLQIQTTQDLLLLLQKKKDEEEEEERKKAFKFLQDLSEIQQQQKNNENKEGKDESNISSFSCHNFSVQTNQKISETSILILNSQKQLGEQTAKEINDFANDISTHLSNVITRQRKNSEDSQISDCLTSKKFDSEITRGDSPSNVDTPVPSSPVDELVESSLLVKMKELTTSTMDEQNKEIDSIKEEGRETALSFLKIAQNIHDSTVDLVSKESAKLI